MKIAIVHDYLNQYGGAERVVETLHELYPEAPVYTSLYTPESMPDSFRQMDIRTTFLQKFPLKEKYFKYFLLFYPRAMESIDLSGYDIILSSSSSFAKGIRSPNGALHICYCYTPTRFIWNYKNYVQKEGLTRLVSKILPFIIRRLKRWDLNTVSRIDYFIAISNNISKKIKECYGRDSEVIYPPVNISLFDTGTETEDYFFIVSRLNSYKNIDLVIKAFNKNGLKLKIVGVGPFEQKLRQMADGANIEFLGRVTDAELKKLYGSCRALIFPGEEDFGITPLEAQASGRPVIAYGKGGSLETIIDGKTGLFFKDNSVGSLAEAIDRFIKIEDSFDKIAIRENALRFRKEIFKDRLKNFIDKKYLNHGNRTK